MKEAVLNILRAASKDNPIRSKVIEKSLGINGIEVRNIIRALRREGHPIALCWHGYYWAVDYNEIKDTIKSLRRRAYSELETAAKLEKCFVRQLKLGV